MSNILELITPGEWEWHGGNSIWNKKTHELVATTVLYTPNATDNSQAASNAKVMAASKRMLDILHRLVKAEIVTYPGSELDNLQFDARELINELNK